MHSVLQNMHSISTTKSLEFTIAITITGHIALYKDMLLTSEHQLIVWHVGVENC